MTEGTSELLTQLREILNGSVPDSDIENEARQILDAFGPDGDKVCNAGRQRAAGMPLALVLGRHKFMGIEILAEPGALAAREETELLGNTAVGWLREIRTTTSRELLAIDMCCGSGNLACGIASAVPGVHFWASDLTDACVALTKRNVERLGLGSRITVLQGDLFAPLGDKSLEGTVDLVVCNPPYISTGRLAKDRAPLLAHEPREAFDGGPYGVSIYQRVVKDALTFLCADGKVMFEVGAGQGAQVAKLLERTGGYDKAELVQDGTGEVRVVVAQKRRN